MVLQADTKEFSRGFAFCQWIELLPKAEEQITKAGSGSSSVMKVCLPTSYTPITPGKESFVLRITDGQHKIARLCLERINSEFLVVSHHPQVVSQDKTISQTVSE